MKVRLQMFVVGIFILMIQISCKKSDSQPSDNSKGNNADLISRFMPADSAYAFFTSIHIDKNNNKWFTTTEGVFKFDGTTWTHYNSSNTAIAFGNTMSLQSDASGIVYAVTQPNINNKPLLAIFKNGVWGSYPLPFNMAKVYFEKQSTNLFVLGDDDLFVYNGTGDYSNYSSYNKILGVPGNSNDCYVNNGIWYCSFRNSNAYDNNKYSGFASTDKNLPQPVYYTPNPNYISMSKVITSNDGTSIILVGTSGNSGSVLNKLYRYQNGVWSVIPYNSADQKLEEVSSIAIAKDGSLWIGSYMDGFAKYYNDKFTFYTYAGKAPVVTGIAVDDNNIKWIATQNGGLLKCTAQ